MRKLYKKNSIGVDTIEAYTCYCGCSCACACVCITDTFVSDKADNYLYDSDSERYEVKVYLLSQE